MAIACWFHVVAAVYVTHVQEYTFGVIATFNLILKLENFVWSLLFIYY